MLKKGDRVRASKKFLNTFPLTKATVGTVLSVRNDPLIRVKWDELKTPWTLHKTFLETGEREVSECDTIDQAVMDWLRKDVPLSVQMMVQRHHFDKLIERIEKVKRGGTDGNVRIQSDEQDGEVVKRGDG